MVDTFLPELRIRIVVHSRKLEHIERQLTVDNGLDAAEGAVRAAIRQNFERERGGDRPWKPLKRRTEMERRRLRLPIRPILYRGQGPTGRADPRVLRDAMLSDEALTRSGQVLIATHPVPDDTRYRGLARQRPMVALGREQAKAVREAVRDSYFGVVRGVVSQPRA